MENNEKDYTEIDLVEVFRVIKNNIRNILVVTLCFVLLAAAYLAISPPTPPEAPKEAPWATRYRSNAKVRIKVNTNAPNFNLAQKCATYANLLSSDSFIGPIREKLGDKMNVGGRGGSPVKDTEIISVYFEAKDPETAQRGNQLLVQSLRDYIQRTEQIGAPQSPPGGGEAALFQRVDCEVIDPASLPTSPIPKPVPKEDPKKPKPKPFDPVAARNRTLAVGALLGLLLGSGYAVMYALMNRKITTEQDVEDYIGLPVLSVIPDEASLREAQGRQDEETAWKKIGGFLWKRQD